MKRYIIVDIDGTCSDPTHRLHWVKEKPKRWDKFHDEVYNDGVHDDIRALIRQFEHDAEIIFVSGRMERCREDTEFWLIDHFFPLNRPLYMRPNDDYRPDYIVKGEIADRLGLTPDNVWFALDDRNQVVDMWRKRGIRCLQVAPGDF